MNPDLNSNYNGSSNRSDNISNFQIIESTKYKIINILSNLLLIITIIVSFIIFSIYKEQFIIFRNNDFDYLMQTNIFFLMLCIVIQIFIILYTLYNAIKQKDMDFKKEFFSDKFFLFPLQNLLFISSYVYGIGLNFVNIEKYNSVYFVFLFIFLFLIILSYITLLKGLKTINQSYNYRICFMVQSSINLSLSIYLFLYGLLILLDIYEFSAVEDFLILFYVIYTIIGITLLAKKDISFSIILIIILVGCICNIYESLLIEHFEKELITLYCCIGFIIICLLYVCIKHRKKIFGFKSDEDVESFLNKRHDNN